MMGPETFDLFLAIAMIAVFALTIGAILLFRRGNDRKRAWLMLVAALVLLGNVLIWTLPGPGLPGSGTS